MSVENAQAFLNRLATDAAFRTEYVSVKSGEDRRQLLLRSEYSFSDEEIRSVLDLTSFQRSFSTDELEALTGSRDEIPSVDAALACGLVTTGL